MAVRALHCNGVIGSSVGTGARGTKADGFFKMLRMLELYGGWVSVYLLPGAEIGMMTLLEPRRHVRNLSLRVVRLQVIVTLLAARVADMRQLDGAPMV
jgi:hypothetical protein